MFEHLLLDPSARERPDFPEGLKNSRVHDPPAPYFLRLWAPSSVTLIQQCFKRH